MSEQEKQEILKWINSISDKRLREHYRRQYFPNTKEKATKELGQYIVKITNNKPCY